MYEKSTKKMLMAMEILVLPIIEKTSQNPDYASWLAKYYGYKSTKLFSHVSSTSVSGILQRTPLRVHYAGCLAGLSIVQIQKIKSR
jgi:hypothetical protein